MGSQKKTKETRFLIGMAIFSAIAIILLNIPLFFSLGSNAIYFNAFGALLLIGIVMVTFYYALTRGK